MHSGGRWRVPGNFRIPGKAAKVRTTDCPMKTANIRVPRQDARFEQTMERV
jgi:hypothetical protein